MYVVSWCDDFGDVCVFNGVGELVLYLFDVFVVAVFGVLLFCMLVYWFLLLFVCVEYGNVLFGVMVGLDGVLCVVVVMFLDGRYGVDFVDLLYVDGSIDVLFVYVDDDSY